MLPVPVRAPLAVPSAPPTTAPTGPPVAAPLAAPAASPDTAPVQRAPSVPATPAAPPTTADTSGTLRWDHLTNMPPSMQRQLERVQQQLSEQAGLVGPPVSIGNTERPLFPLYASTGLALTLPQRSTCPIARWKVAVTGLDESK